MARIENPVTALSCAEEILAAIDEAGDLRLPWRKHDWPKKEGPGAKAWVKPGDIGNSTHKDKSLLKRLRQMAADGLLEEQHAGHCGVMVMSGYNANRISRPMAPRFRRVQNA